MPFRKGAKRKDFARDPVFGGGCVPKSLHLEDSPINKIPKMTLRIKRATLEVNKLVLSIKAAKLGKYSAKTGKIRVKIGVKSTKMSKIWDNMRKPSLLRG